MIYTSFTEYVYNDKRNTYEQTKCMQILQNTSIKKEVQEKITKNDQFSFILNLVKKYSFILCLKLFKVGAYLKKMEAYSKTMDQHKIEPVNPLQFFSWVFSVFDRNFLCLYFLDQCESISHP